MPQILQHTAEMYKYIMNWLLLLNMVIIVFFFSDTDFWKHTLVSGQLTDAIKSNKLKQTCDFLYAEVVPICKYMQYKVILIVPVRTFFLLDGLWYRLPAESPHTRPCYQSSKDYKSYLISNCADEGSSAFSLKQQKRMSVMWQNLQ